LSTATSPHAKSVAALKEDGDAGNSSPNQKNPKKAVQATAHITTLLGFEEA